MRVQFAVSLLIGCLVGSVSMTARSATFSLIPFNEPVGQLVAPSSSIAAFSYVNGVATVATSTLVLCSNTSASTTGSQFVPQFYSSYAIANGGNSPLPFVFGASANAVTPPVSGLDTMLFNYDGATGNETLQVGTGSATNLTPNLVCYGLDASGAHKLTRDLFASGFEDPATEGLIGNSTVSLKVFHLPSSATDYYGYLVSVTIPALPINADCSTLDCNFSLVEGYDTSVFGTATGGWCQVNSSSDNSCASYGGYLQGDINVNYKNYGGFGTPNLQAPISPAGSKTFYFVVYRYLKSGLNALPNVSGPLVVAALFSPLDLDENKLDDNVSVGINQVSN